MIFKIIVFVLAAIDLISILLQVKKKKRPSVDKTLFHPWLQVCIILKPSLRLTFIPSFSPPNIGNKHEQNPLPFLGNSLSSAYQKKPGMQDQEI